MGDLLGNLGVRLVGDLAGAAVRNFSKFWRWRKARDMPPADGTHFTILIADLENDDANRGHAKHVTESLRGLKGVRVRRYGRTLAIDDHGDQTEAFIKAETTGREWLAEQNADLLIWGRVGKADQILHLRFIARGVAATESGNAYRLETDTLRLPKNFDADLANALVATALSALEPADELDGQYIVDLLRPVAEKMENLLAAPIPGLAGELLASLQVAFGTAAGRMGEQAEKPVWLEKSVTAFRAALEVRTRDRLPFDWAMTQHNLGNALGRLGAREGGTARLEEAVAAFRAALGVYTRDGLPLNWATAQSSLGTALESLGEREGGTARLEEAVAAYCAALEVRTRDRLPFDWAMTQHNLGIALRSLGAHEGGTRRLEEAVAAFRAALEVRTRDGLPFGWAATQNSLGKALLRLGEREGGTARLEEALTAFDEVLSELRKMNAIYYVDDIQQTRQRVLQLIAERKGRRQ